MKKKDNENKIEEEYPIKTSDWLVYLNSLISGNRNIFILLLTIFFIGIIGLIEIGILTASNPFSPYLALGSVFFMSFILYIVVKKFDLIIKPYQDLSEEIIMGKITKPEDILNRYKKLIKKKKK